ncbi:LPXTG cell wall anchor domain-containing protein [Virgibacillus sp. MSP4-1]|uniref:LPXTG cell wall anchor domain-containing protein n=1 Tax=Virgibacillus sp. MSP4-1 TaxID=2700081 RepID=UPI00039D7249|nr:LPXTG cell wall anchor domain-containing protein [Virgibacillus sp. MSP4-1]QHS24364.1 LPXTG cell wall anchor domain-containing protein [Virgibacillus sp. MSP4-1]
MKKLLVLLLSGIIIFAFPAYLEATINGEKDQSIDIATSPHKIFFNLQNLKPGDFSTKEMTIYNKGEEDFNYLFTNRFLTGSEKLYNEFLLTVRDKNGVLFDGKLKNFEELASRELKSGDSEVLTFKVEMPYELGNEFQGLSTEFQFKVFVEGTLGGAIPVEHRLPETSTNMFHYMILGIMLLLGGGSLYYFQKRKKNIDKE